MDWVKWFDLGFWGTIGVTAAGICILLAGTVCTVLYALLVEAYSAVKRGIRKMASRK